MMRGELMKCKLDYNAVRLTHSCCHKKKEFFLTPFTVLARTMNLHSNDCVSICEYVHTCIVVCCTSRIHDLMYQQR